MNKKFLSAVLFGALLASSTGTFVSCKDYDDDITELWDAVNKGESSVSALETQLATLQTAAAAAQTAADAAKAAADKAQATGDAATAAAQEALAAANQAKADAIAEAEKQVTALKTLLQGAIDQKLDTSAFDAALLVLNAQIEGIEAGLSTLDTTVEGINGTLAEHTKDIKTAQDAITNLVAADADLQKQLDALKTFAEATDGQATTNKEDIAAAQEAILAAQAGLKEVWEELAGENGLQALVGQNASLIQSLLGITDDHDSRIEALEGALGLSSDDIKDLTENLKTTNGKITTLQNDLDTKIGEVKGEISRVEGLVNTANGEITKIQSELSTLHTLVVSRLTSITFAPNDFVDGIEAIVFNSLTYAPMDADENATVPAEATLSTASLATASYHFNPASFKLTNADYQFIDRVANTRSVQATDLLAIEGAPTADAAKGTVDFKLRRQNAHSTQPGENKINIVALQATLKGEAVAENEKNVVVTSPYVQAFDETVAQNDLFISDKESLATTGEYAHYATTFAEAAKDGVEARYKVVYNEEFNLRELVATCLFKDEAHKAFAVEDYKLDYRFYVAETPYYVKSDATKTNQNDVLECTDEVAGTYKVPADIMKEAIGRTPILKVELVDSEGNVVRRGFVKVEVTANKTQDLIAQDVKETLVYDCAQTEAHYELDEEWMRKNVYRVITDGKNTSISHEEFWNIYEPLAYPGVVTKNGGYQSTMPNGSVKLVDGVTSQGTATKKITWDFKHGQLGNIGAEGATFVATATLYNKLASSDYPEKVELSIVLKVVLPTMTVNSQINEEYWQKNENGEFVAFKVNVAVPSSKTDVAANCVFSTPLDQAYSKFEVKGLPECYTKRYEIVQTTVNGVVTTHPLLGVSVDKNGNIVLDKNNVEVKEALNSVGGLQALVENAIYLESGDRLVANTFVVNFITPVQLNMPTGLSVQDAKTGGDVVDFQWNNLLTDWRGESIFAPSQTSVEYDAPYWNKVCAPHFEVIPAWDEIVPEKWEITTKTIKVNGYVTKYGGTATYEYKWFNRFDPWGRIKTTTETVTVGNEYQSQSDVRTYLMGQAPAGQKPGRGWELFSGPTLTDVKYTTEEVAGPVEITVIDKINYIAAKVTHHDAEMVPTPCNDKPAYDGTQSGQTVGCWQWTSKTEVADVFVPGQYWDFYGPIGEVKLFVDKATTNLGYNGGQLPAEATLVQEGNTVKYINVKSPVGYAYEITIPAKVSYGWGVATDNLVITVNPVQ